ncbi:MAG: hypothetical protein WA125_16650 [Desulfosporosinus sp.]
MSDKQSDIQSDTQRVDLTQTARDACKKFYAKKCGECPLRPAVAEIFTHTGKIT